MRRRRKSKLKSVLISLIVLTALAGIVFFVYRFVGNMQENIENPVYITEYMSSNTNTIKDEDGDYNDWIEIYNASNEPINLEGYFLSDDKEVLDKWKFPNVEIGPKSYMIIFASGKDKTDPDGELHTNFSLDRKGEVLSFTKPSGEVIDNITTVNVPSDVSYGRTKNDRRTWLYFTEPTPGKENNTKGIKNMPTELRENNPTVYINEILVSNDSGITDKDEDHEDWIELYNPTDGDVNLKGYFLSDSDNDAFKWVFPDVTIKANDYLIVFASGKNRVDEDGELHTNFKLNKTKENLYFRTPQGRIIDKIVINSFLTDVSYGRSKETKGAWAFFEEPTPGKDNNTRESLGILKEPAYSKPGGFYNDNLYIDITSEIEGAEIRYTLDGSTPTAESSLYQGPILIDKTTVVRAKAFKDGYITPEGGNSQTYFINEKHNLPVVSIAISPKDFSDPVTGMYSKGPGASSDFPYFGANFWKDIENPAHFAFYEADGKLGYDCHVGLRIFGGWTRGYDQKSLALMARDRYETNEMSYKFLENKDLPFYKNLVLRTGGQDVNKSKIKDLIFSKLAVDLNVDYMGYRQVVLYINGEYWGIYSLREKINEHFIANNNGIEDPDTVNLLEGESITKHGVRDEYDKMVEFIEKNDMKVKENYEKVKSMMDISSFIDFQATQMYSSNTDSGNIRYWKADKEGSKWKWVLFDMDMSFQQVQHDTVAFLMNSKGTGANNMFSTVIIRKLMENPEFRQQFLERFAYLLKNNFSAENVLAAIDELSSQIEPEIERNAERWGAPTKEYWENQIYNLKYFAERRVNVVINCLDKNLKLTESEKALFK